MTHYSSRTIIHSYCSVSLLKKLYLVQLWFIVPPCGCCVGSVGVYLCSFLLNNPWTIICYGEWNGLLWFSPLKMWISWLDWSRWYVLEIFLVPLCAITLFVDIKKKTYHIPQHGLHTGSYIGRLPESSHQTLLQKRVCRHHVSYCHTCPT